MNTTVGNAVGLKQLNRVSVLGMFLEQSPLTKAEIAAHTQLTFATVSNLVGEMQGEDLILELGFAESNGGRKPALYGINPNAFYLIGVDLQVEKIICVLTNLEGEVVHSEVEAYQVEAGPYNALRTIKSLVERLLSVMNIAQSQVRGLGVSAPGPVDTEEGIIISPPNMPGWRNVPFVDLLVGEFGIPCYLEKDANAAAIGESRYGAGKGVRDLVYLMVDVGIGGGIVIHNDIHRGFLSGAGEIGHMLIDVDGPYCNCGRQGCVEAVASGLAIEREVTKETGEVFGLDELLDKAGTGWEPLDRQLTRAGEFLGLAIGNICNMLNPQKIILGGAVAERSDSYFQHAHDKARERILTEYSQRIQIVRATLGHLSGAIGAATIAFRHVIYQTA